MAVQPEKQSGNGGSTESAAQTARSTTRYVDRPDCNEVFADTISSLGFDGQTLRIEFAVSRVDQASQSGQVVRNVYPAARLVLTPGAAADLMRKLQQMAGARAGAQKPAPAQSE